MRNAVLRLRPTSHSKDKRKRQHEATKSQCPAVTLSCLPSEDTMAILSTATPRETTSTESSSFDLSQQQENIRKDRFHTTNRSELDVVSTLPRSLNCKIFDVALSISTDETKSITEEENGNQFQSCLYSEDASIRKGKAGNCALAPTFLQEIEADNSEVEGNWDNEQSEKNSEDIREIIANISLGANYATSNLRPCQHITAKKLCSCYNQGVNYRFLSPRRLRNSRSKEETISPATSRDSSFQTKQELYFCDWSSSSSDSTNHKKAVTSHVLLKEVELLEPIAEACFNGNEHTKSHSSTYISDFESIGSEVESNFEKSSEMNNLKFLFSSACYFNCSSYNTNDSKIDILRVAFDYVNLKFNDNCHTANNAIPAVALRQAQLLLLIKRYQHLCQLHQHNYWKGHSNNRKSFLGKCRTQNCNIFSSACIAAKNASDRPKNNECMGCQLSKGSTTLVEKSIAFHLLAFQYWEIDAKSEGIDRSFSKNNIKRECVNQLGTQPFQTAANKESKINMPPFSVNTFNNAILLYHSPLACKEHCAEEPDGSIGKAMRNFFMEKLGYNLSFYRVQAFVALIFLLYLGLSTYGISKIKVGLSMEDLFAKDSHLRLTNTILRKEASEIGEPTCILFPDPVIWWDHDVRTAFLQLSEKLQQKEYYVDMLNGMEAFLRENHTNLSQVDEGDFIIKLKEWLAGPIGRLYEAGFVFDETGHHLNHLRFNYYHSLFNDPDARRSFMTGIRELLDGYGDKFRAVAYGSDFKFLEADLVIWFQTITGVLCALSAVFLVSCIMLDGYFTVILVMLALTSLIYGLLGLMPFLGLRLNMISMVTLVMSIGFCVDYTLHVAHAFDETSTPCKKIRIMAALALVGTAVLNGGLTTFLSILPLAWRKEFLQSLFFKMISVVSFNAK
ncbi:hypothetical protein IE077_002124 [Cardiosporidium cionae]|uniref:Uncharacterized protein n=1 Tax=Cardiosporidium cionae TaxID=476202 RepID=A0ABQ7JBF9_9APIC|nr:hypothetical protein IE077_002124 [Cardiosporidium cionae]|eukprot:KAF8821346.1 hypothetical protein IE077_002124 [Cardiosporidium cionae]